MKKINESKPKNWKAEISKEWRKRGMVKDFGRLYWKKNNWRWYKSWGEEIARCDNMLFMSSQAILDFIEEANQEPFAEEYWNNLLHESFQQEIFDSQFEKGEDHESQI